MANESIGQVVAVRGAVVDVEFPPDELPEIYHAIEIAREVAKCDNAEVRGELALNSHAPLEVVAALVRDSDEKVRSIACHAVLVRSGELSRALEDAPADSKRIFAESACTAPTVLAALAEDQEREVRLRVAGNAACPEVTLRALASDQDPGVREAAAKRAGEPSAAVR